MVKNFKEMEIEEFVGLSKRELVELIAFAKVGEMKAFLKKLGYNKTSKMKKVDCIEALKDEIKNYEEAEKSEDRSEMNFKVDVAQEMAKRVEDKYDTKCRVNQLIALFGRKDSVEAPDKNEVVLDSFEEVKRRLVNNQEKLETLIKLKNEIEDVNRKLDGTGLFVKLEIKQNIKSGEILYDYALVGNGCFVDSFDLDFREEEGEFSSLLAPSLGIIPSWFEKEWLEDYENDSENDFGGIRNWRNKVIISLEDNKYIELKTNNDSRGIDYSKDLLSIKLQTIQNVENLEIEIAYADTVGVNNEDWSIMFNLGIEEIAKLFKYVNNDLTTNTINYNLDRAVQDIDTFTKSVEYIDDKIEQAELIDFNSITDKMIVSNDITKFLEADYTEVEAKDEEYWDFN